MNGIEAAGIVACAVLAVSLFWLIAHQLTKERER